MSFGALKVTNMASIENIAAQILLAWITEKICQY